MNDHEQSLAVPVGEDTRPPEQTILTPGKRNEELQVFMSQLGKDGKYRPPVPSPTGWWFVEETGCFEDPLHGCVGLKIHIALDWQDPFYMDVVKAVTDICAQENSAGRATSFKVVIPTFQAHASPRNPGKLKGITIYSLYLPQGETNVSETVRLVEALKPIVGQYPVLDERVINQELKVGAGIFLRPGALTKEGEEFASSNRRLPFLTQLRKMRLVNPKEFERELREVGYL